MRLRLLFDALRKLLVPQPAEAVWDLKARLVEDCKLVFARAGADRMPVRALAAALADRPPWSTWSRGRPIRARALTELLRDAGVEPRVIRIGSKTYWGYMRTDFELVESNATLSE